MERDLRASSSGKDMPRWGLPSLVGDGLVSTGPPERSREGRPSGPEAAAHGGATLPNRTDVTGSSPSTGSPCVFRQASCSRYIAVLEPNTDCSFSVNFGGRVNGGETTPPAPSRGTHGPVDVFGPTVAVMSRRYVAGPGAT
jgi:hypothetical protein